MEQAWAAVEPRPGYAWRWLTLTTKYDPYSEADCTWEALRSRARACAKAAKLVWEKLLSQNPGSGCIRTIEVSRRGHVHANLIFFGPAIDLEEVERIVKRAGDCLGHAHISQIDRNVQPEKRKPGKQKREDEFEKSEDPRGSLEGLKRVARYVAKGIDHESRAGTLRDEDLVTGMKSAKLVDPALAVRWEFGTRKMHLVQRYGALRGLELDEHEENKPADNEDDAEVTCECCGSVGHWHTGFRGVEDWFHYCHENGKKALHSTSDSWTSALWAPDRPD